MSHELTQQLIWIIICIEENMPKELKLKLNKSGIIEYYIRNKEILFEWLYWAYSLIIILGEINKFSINGKSFPDVLKEIGSVNIKNFSGFISLFYFVFLMFYELPESKEIKELLDYLQENRIKMFGQKKTKNEEFKNCFLYSDITEFMAFKYQRKETSNWNDIKIEGMNYGKIVFQADSKSLNPSLFKSEYLIPSQQIHTINGLYPLPESISELKINQPERHNYNDIFLLFNYYVIKGNLNISEFIKKRDLIYKEFLSPFSSKLLSKVELNNKFCLYIINKNTNEACKAIVNKRDLFFISPSTKIDKGLGYNPFYFKNEMKLYEIINRSKLKVEIEKTDSCYDVIKDSNLDDLIVILTTESDSGLEWEDITSNGLSNNQIPIAFRSGNDYLKDNIKKIKIRG
jgi:hypothetical protein